MIHHECNKTMINKDHGVQRKTPAGTRDPSSSELLAWIEEEVSESLRVKRVFLQDCAETLAAICLALAERFERGGKLLLFGNGGSAADAQHIAAEFVGRYRCERAAIPAMALTVNSSTLTAVANDYGYDEVFARQVAAFGTERRRCDRHFDQRELAKCVALELPRHANEGFLPLVSRAANGGQLRDAVDLSLTVPSTVTPRIQECHILAGHIVSGYCERVSVEQAAKSRRRG